MKFAKGSYLSGYIEIQVIGDNPEHFLHKCTTKGIMLWDIQKQAMDQCTAIVNLKDVKEIRKLRRGSGYKIRFNQGHGIPFLNKKVRSQKPFLIGLLLSILLFFMLTNMLWQVKVTGVTVELENKIYEHLSEYGVKPGAFTFNLASPNQIQQLLLEDVPELLWVGVEKKGTSISLEAVEKLIITDEEEKSARHLVANKNGVIKSMYVKRGQPQVTVNDFVEKGNVLVSGEIEKMNLSSDEDDATYEYVAAEGDVIATTWYKAEVTIPLQSEHIELTGNKKTEYKLGIGSVTLPLWPWHSEGFSSEVQETEVKQLELFGWKFPLSLIVKTRFESFTDELDRKKEEAIQIGIRQAKEDLLRELNKEAEIITEKVLHESTEHGKVKLSLYITVEENIAIEQPISQGD